jgi:hypothetical protein
VLSEREVLEGQLLMPAARQGQRSRNQHEHVHHADIVSCAAREDQPAWARM